MSEKDNRIDTCLKNQLTAEQKGQQCYRLYNSSELRVERYGQRIISSLFDIRWDPKELHNELSQLSADLWIYRLMPNRGVNPEARDQWVFDSSGKEVSAQETWIVEEGTSKFLLKLNQGKSYGLFLDQLKNRDNIAEISKGKTLLNLFCYTGSFSVRALCAGATHTTQVDTSGLTLDWLVENMKLNEITEDRFKNHKMGSLEFLKWAKKKNLSYDIIVCDPPSFSRGKKGPFQFEKSWKELFFGCEELLNPKGSLLFSCNFEKWSQEKFQSQIEWFSGEFDNTRFPQPTWDIQSGPVQLRSALLQKK